MKVINRKTGNKIDVEWVSWGNEPLEKCEVAWINAHNAKNSAGRFVDTNFNYYTDEELIFDVCDNDVKHDDVN